MAILSFTLVFWFLMGWECAVIFPLYNDDVKYGKYPTDYKLLARTWESFRLSALSYILWPYYFNKYGREIVTWGCEKSLVIRTINSTFVWLCYPSLRRRKE